MRKLMWLSIGFCAACALGAYLFPGNLLFLIGILLAAVGIGLLCLRKKNFVRTMAVVCLGMACGLLRYGIYDSAYLSDIRNLDGETVTLTAQAEDFSFETTYGIAVDAVAELSGRNYHARIYLHQKEPVSPGTQISGSFSLRYTAPGGEKPTYHSGNGILLLAYPSGDSTVIAPKGISFRHGAAYLRQYLLELIGQILPADAVPFAKSLLLGDTSELDYETETDLSASGIRHVAAVSGLHVSILFSLVYLFSGRRRGLSFALGVPILFLFAAMAGFSPSIVRASVMQLLVLLALLLKREYDPPTALAFAVLVMLAANPLTITSAGFQLSVASVVGIFLFCGRISQWLLAPKRFGRWNKKKLLWKILTKIAASVAVSLSAWIATTPLTAWYFGTVSLFSALTNLLCLWVVTLLFCGIIAACVLGAVWLPLGKIFGWILGWLVRYILFVSGAIAAIPVSVAYTVSPYIVAWLVLCYLLLAVFLFSKQRRPLILLCCAVFSLCTAMVASWAEPLLDDYRVTLVDVGQGQCVLLQSKGKTFMVDCGGEYDESTADAAASLLLSQGIQRLDGMILTHYDKDHINGAGKLLYRVKTDLLILPNADGWEKWEADILKHHAGELLRGQRMIQLKHEDIQITVFPSWTKESSNESSLCVLFQTEKCAILITGDRSAAGEEILLKTAQIPKLDALVVGHHGAHSSTGDALLEATKPKVALISVGADNAYEHPSQSVLERLKRYGCQIRRTDLEGTIIFRG